MQTFIIQHYIGERGISMSNWKKIKIISIFVIVIVILSLVMLFNNKKNDINIYNNKTNENDIKLNMDDDFINIIYYTVKKNSDWTNLPLSNKFKNKYNPQNGILNDDGITNISGGGDSDKDKQIVVLNIFHNSKKEEYHIHYILNEQNELDDVEIVNKKLLYDENGKEVIEKANTSAGAIISLCAPYRLEYNPLDYYNVTENYIKKWGGGFIPQQAIQGVLDIPKLNDEVNNIVYIESEYPELDESESIIIGEGLKRYFRVHYFVDENMWLDDVEVEEVSKTEIDRLLASIN